MSKALTTYLAGYGKVAIPKHYCPECHRTAFVIDGEMACCGLTVEIELQGYKQEIERIAGRKFRRSLPKTARAALLAAQDYRCFYCERAFGSVVWRGAKRITLQIHYDHVVPRAFIARDDAHNFVASCHVCNLLKSSLCFETVAEAKIYLADQWETKGYR